MYSVGKITGNFLSPLTTEDSMRIVEAAAAEFKASLVIRVGMGLGLDDGAMKYKGKVYSARYALKRAKTKRDVDKRYLNWSGNMLGGIDPIEAETKGTQAISGLTIAGDQTEKALYNQAMTPWFGASPVDKEVIMETAQDVLNTILKEKENG